MSYFPLVTVIQWKFSKFLFGNDKSRILFYYTPEGQRLESTLLRLIPRRKETFNRGLYYRSWGMDHGVSVLVTGGFHRTSLKINRRRDLHFPIYYHRQTSALSIKSSLIKRSGGIDSITARKKYFKLFDYFWKRIVPFDSRDIPIITSQTKLLSHRSVIVSREREQMKISSG